VASERSAGYDRDKFGDWVDADRDCKDTRAEVLVAESHRAVTGRCLIARGLWRSYYDRRVWRSAGDVDIDIDHMVPLSEAWKSGARRWTPATRVRFANDLGDARALVAVTDSVNQSKGDQDPTTWMPTYDKCRYLREWVAVKLRWRLTVDSTEKSALKSKSASCTNVTITVTRAI